MARGTSWWAAVAVAAWAACAARAEHAPAIRPGAEGALSANVLPDGQAQLENEALRIVFEPRDAGAASSIVQKATGKEMAVCVTYGEKHYKAFREALNVQLRKEGHIDPEGQPYELIRLDVGGGQAAAAFTGYPYVPPDDAEETVRAYGKVRIVKTYTLAAGESRLRVDVRVVNESDRTLPVALWLLNGVRVEGLDVDNMVPTLSGTLVKRHPWIQKGSSFNVATDAAGPWAAHIAVEDPRPGIVVAGHAPLVDTVFCWLAKFPGDTLCLGTRMFDFPPGASESFPYVFMATRSLPRVDAASRDLVCGIELKSEKANPQSSAEATVWVLSPVAARATAVLKLRRLPDGQETELGRAEMTLEAGVAASAPFTAKVGGDGTYVLAAEVQPAAGAALRAERPLEAGVTGEQYRAARPDLAGKPFWSLEYGEKPLPAWMLACRREVPFPMVPWNVPAAGEPLKVLFCSEIDWTIGSLRELGRRCGYTWDLALLYGKETYGSGPYRDTEQGQLEAKLNDMKPDCLLTAGVRYDALRNDVRERILARVRAGMGLVMTGNAIAGYAEWPPKLLVNPDVKKVDADINGPLASLFTSEVCGRGGHKVECYELGRGRIVVITKTFPYTRDGLMPSLTNLTRLPDQEYHLAEYVRAIRYASGRRAPVRLLGLKLAADGLEATCESDAARRVALACVMVSTDLLHDARAVQAVDLAAGESTHKVSLVLPPGGNYAVHAWALDGEAQAARKALASGDALYRADMGLPVLDFAATYATVASPVRIKRVTVEDGRERVPKSITVECEADPGAATEGLAVEADIRNGGDGRIVWRGVRPLGAERKATFDGIAYEPVSPDSLAAARVVVGGRTICAAGARFSARHVGNVADDDVAFLTSAGVHDSLFAFRLTKSWAEEQAGIDFTQPAGMSQAGFPWKQNKDRTTTPPMVDTEFFRAYVAKELKGPFERLGTAYFYLADEFKLGDEYDVSPETLAAFAEHLKASYGTVEKLNASWGTDFKDFAEAKPIFFAQAQKQPDRPARWLDFRLFMDGLVTNRYRIASEEAAKVSPLVRTGPSGAYEPGYLIGVNYYDISRYCRFIASYANIRADWFRAFAPEDAVIQLWIGYGGQQPVHPWETAFRGFSGVSWWGYVPAGTYASKGALIRMGVVALDGLPNRNYEEIGRQQMELRAGLGKLLRTSRPAEPRAYLPYSQVSAYVANVLERNHADGSTAGAALLRGANVPYSFVADEEAPARLGAMRDKLFVLAGSDAMPVGAAAAYAQAVERGCSALADAEVASRDGHGNVLPAGALDGVFGIDTAASKALRRGKAEAVAWSAEAPEELRKVEGRMVKAREGLKAAGGVVWASFADGTPAVVAKRSAAGSPAVYLNTRLEWLRPAEIDRCMKPAEGPAPSGPEAVVAAAFRRVLSEAKVFSPVRVAPETLRPGLVAAFERGRARYYGLLLGDKEGQAAVALPAKAHTYDVRAGTYLGEVDAFKDRFDPKRLAKVYAQLPYAVKGIAAAADATAKKGGESVRIEGRVMADGEVTEHHVVHCEVVAPSGARPPYYRRNLDAPKGVFRLAVPLALNAEPGEWKVELRDAATGVRTVESFTVAPEKP